MEHGTHTKVIQVLLGHSSERSTQTYMHVSPQTLSKAVSPLDRLLAPDSRDNSSD